MIEFKNDVKNILPYDRRQYIDFLFDDVEPTHVKWYGVSFQLNSDKKETTLAEFIEKYEPWFKNIVSTFDNSTVWVVNHDKKDLKWFPTDEENLKSLRALFKEKKISNGFKGALTFTEDDLLEFSKDLLSYPYAVFNEDGLFYMNIDISHSEMPFIMKISDHLNVDLICTDKKLLKKVVNEHSPSLFIVKEYRGTSLY